MIHANFHTHTTLCDGKDTPEAMAGAALALCFRQLGFSGHMDPDIHMDWPAYRRRIEALREAYRGRMDILCGVELDADWDGEKPEGAEYIIGSVHFLPDAQGRLTALDDTYARLEGLCRERFGGDWYTLCAAYFARVARVAEETRCDIIGHFDLVARFNHEHPSFDETDPRYLKPAMEALTALAETGVPFELNCGAYNRGRRRDFYPARPLLRELVRRGTPIFLSSDAHSRDLLDGGFADAAACLRSCGCGRVSILRHEDGRVVRREAALD